MSDISDPGVSVAEWESDYVRELKERVTNLELELLGTINQYEDRLHGLSQIFNEIGADKITLQQQVDEMAVQLSDYDRVLSQYAEAANWQQNPISDTEQDRLWMLTEHGYSLAGDVLEKYATTAPATEQGA